MHLDHVAWFVHGLQAATGVFEHLGFTLTPVAEHRQSPRGDPAARPTGTANRCAMLERGYLEVLGTVPGIDAPLVRQHRAALARHEGVHLIAFATEDPAAALERLKAEGFEPLEPAHLRRPVPGPAAPGAQLAFTVIRVPPGTMAEGRIQIVRHETPGLLWRPHLTVHANGVSGLEGALVCVEDPREAAARYGRFLGVPWRESEDRTAVVLDRGRIEFATPAACGTLLPGLVPVATPPRIVAIHLAATDILRTRSFFAARGIGLVAAGDGAFVLDPGDALGAALVISSTGHATSGSLKNGGEPRCERHGAVS